MCKKFFENYQTSILTFLDIKKIISERVKLPHSEDFLLRHIGTLNAQNRIHNTKISPSSSGIYDKPAILNIPTVLVLRTYFFSASMVVLLLQWCTHVTQV